MIAGVADPAPKLRTQDAPPAVRAPALRGVLDDLEAKARERCLSRDFQDWLRSMVEGCAHFREP